VKRALAAATLPLARCCLAVALARATLFAALPAALKWAPATIRLTRAFVLAARVRVLPNAIYRSFVDRIFPQGNATHAIPDSIRCQS
jgi:hypothetical protein